MLKKKLEKTEKELKETLQRMSSIVQKSNQPVAELTDKLKAAEKALADEKEKCEKLNAELGELSGINSTMQETHADELHKQKDSAETELERLRSEN